MTASRTDPRLLARRPRRADARRNHDKLVAAAREAFAAAGAGTALEDVARRAEVGIGTLYRHFPTRQHLVEAVYLDEVEAMSRSAAQLGELEPWDALAAWLHRFVDFATTKRALAEELVAHMGADAELFGACRAAITQAGDGLLRRAQEAGAVRPDASFSDVGRMVAGIAAIRGADRDEIDRILDLALDGLRYRPQPPAS